MTLATDTSGARAFARLDSDRRGAAPRPAVAAEPAATVTLDKIGDFLELDFRRLSVWLRRGALLAGIFAVVGAGLGVTYSLLAKPKYTVGSEVLIDPDNLQVVPNELVAQPVQVDGQVLNAGTKLRVLTSGNVLSRVVDELGLVNDTEFYDPSPRFSLGGLFGATPGVSDPKLVALGNLAARVASKADEKSFVATLAVSAETPEKAIRISTAIVKSFQDELAKAEADAAGRTAKALDDRLSALKGGVEAAEQKVEAYKRENSLSSGSDGALVSTQTLTQLNGQMIEAQSRLIAAQSSYDALRAAGAGAGTAAAAGSAALGALRARAGDLAQQLDARSKVYGPRHPSIVDLKAQLATVEAQLAGESARLVAAAKSTLDEAGASLAALRAQTEGLKSSVFSDSESQVALRELERDAASKTAIYESFLARARQITEQGRIDSTNVRVISTPVPPDARAWPPRPILALLLGAIAGLGLGLLLAIVVGVVRDLRRPPRPGAAA